MQITSPILDGTSWYGFPSQPNPTAGVRWKPYARGTGRPWPGVTQRGHREPQLRGLSGAPAPLRAGNYRGAPGKKVKMQLAPLQGLAGVGALEARHIAHHAALAGLGLISKRTACDAAAIGTGLVSAFATAAGGVTERRTGSPDWDRIGKVSDRLGAVARRACAGDPTAQRQLREDPALRAELERMRLELEAQRQRAAQQPKQWIEGVPNAVVLLGAGLLAAVLLRK